MDEQVAAKDFDVAEVTLKCNPDGIDKTDGSGKEYASFNPYVEIEFNVMVDGNTKTITVEGTDETYSVKELTFSLEGLGIKKGQTFKIEAVTNAYGSVGSEPWLYEISVKYPLVDDSGDQEPGGDDVQKSEKVKTEISSVKMAFDYEKTGQNAVTSLKVCGTEVNGFNGDGSYEVEIAENAWNTWDKTGFYNLGFIASDTEYALKNVTLTVNGKYEFILGETKTSEYNEAKKTYKVDFPNMWGSYSEGDVLFTSKDGKADIVSGGNNVVMSLYVESDSTSTPTPAPTKKPSRPSYVIPTATPTIEPTASPTIAPTATPTAAPTVTPTAVPTIKPTVAPTATATPASTIAPTVVPTIESTTEPTVKPTEAPVIPTKAPAEASKVQKGDKVTVSGQKYVVTNASQKTVSYVAPKNSKKTVVSVPATVKVKVNGKNVTYKVTSIQEKAFKGNKKLKKITVNKNIKSIGKDAFKNCSNLKTIVIKSSSITKVGKDALKGTAKNLVIKVPAKKVSAYKKLFKNKGNSSIVIKKI